MNEFLNTSMRHLQWEYILQTSLGTSQWAPRHWAVFAQTNMNGNRIMPQNALHQLGNITEWLAGPGKQGDGS